jgi:cyclopropane-fatty-acyl-phospholipid synthase
MSRAIESPDEVESGIRFHYDLPPEFFALFLDKTTMSYTCAYFRDGNDTLDQAQERKIEMVFRKLQLKPGDRVLDIGCGWGNVVLRAAQLGCQVTGLTLAVEQARYVEAEAARRGLSDRVRVVVQEARELPFEDASFDKIVTIGATEQIADIDLLFKEVSRVLTDEGLCLEHSIKASNEPDDMTPELEFMTRHIFPTGHVKRLGEYINAFEAAGLEVVDVHNMTDNYPLTLRRWQHNLEHAGEAAAAAVGVPGDRYRAQRLFLAGCIVAFAEAHSFLYQEVVRKTTPGVYRQTLAAGRESFRLDDPPSAPLPSPLIDNPLVSLEVRGGMGMWVEGVGGSLQSGAPPRHPDCQLSVDATTMQKVISGEMQVIDAYLGGLIDIEGELLAAVQVGSALLSLGR